jgi:hypothetical protein
MSNCQERYQRWANLDPKLIDRLPVKEKTYLIARVKEIQTQTSSTEQSTVVEQQQQSKLFEEDRIQAAKSKYIHERSSAITPEVLPEISEHFVTGLIVIIGAIIFGGGVGTLMKDSGKEEYALIGGAIGGCVIGGLAEFSGKKLFIERAMSKQYYAERNRLVAQKQEIEKSFVTPNG